METFLTTSKSALNALPRYQRVTVVLGNCTCDLDSAVCALAQGFFYYHDLDDDSKTKVAVIPVMNVTEKEFRVKTEVKWVFMENKIHTDLLIFRDQIDLDALHKDNRLELILVDHHTLPDKDLQLADCVIEIIDHRPQDPAWLWPGTKITLDCVRSCATIIAKNILAKNPKILDAQLRNLLKGPILVDTHNFSVEAESIKTDFEVIRLLEELESSPATTETRKNMFDKILAAKTDITGLTGEDLLIKDLKIVDGVAIPGFPILVEKFIELPNSLEDVLSFTIEGSFALAVLLGMDLKGEKMRRDIGIFVPRAKDEDEPLESKIVSSLRDSTDPCLGLELLMDKVEGDPGVCGNGYKFILFKQKNVKPTRKQILPIVQGALASVRR